MHEPCKVEIGNPQGKAEGIWATVAEYVLIDQRLKKSTVYEYIKTARLKSKKIKNVIHVWVDNPHDVNKLMYLRQHKEELGKPEKERKEKKKYDRCHYLKLNIPIAKPDIMLLLPPYIANPQILGIECDNIGTLFKDKIRVDEATYKSLSEKAKELGISINELAHHIIYQSITNS